MMDQGFGGREEGMVSGMGGYGNIEVSSEYTAAVNNILGNDTDVANLLSQGYNVTAIHPIIKTSSKRTEPSQSKHPPQQCYWRMEPQTSQSLTLTSQTQKSPT